jgi:hypothetical protein
MSDCCAIEEEEEEEDDDDENNLGVVIYTIQKGMIVCVCVCVRACLHACENLTGHRRKLQQQRNLSFVSSDCYNDEVGGARITHGEGEKYFS